MRTARETRPGVLGHFGVALTVLALAATGCKCSERSAPSAASGASASAAPKKPQPTLSGPLGGPAWLELGQASAPADSSQSTPASGPGWAVWVPLGAVKPRPIVVLLDGASADKNATLPAQLFDRLNHDVFVMSFRGAPNETRASLRVALTQLKERFGAYVAPGSVLLVATARFGGEAANLLREEPAFFSRALLFELDPEVWSSTLAYVFGARGGERLVFTTTDPARRAGIEHTKTITQRAGAQARSLFVPVESPIAPGAPLPPPVVDAALAELPFLLSGDGRFPAATPGGKPSPSAEPSGTPGPAPKAPSASPSAPAKGGPAKPPASAAPR